MAEGNHVKGVVSALLKSLAVFVLDFIINIIWSIIALIIFAVVFSSVGGALFSTDEMLRKTASSPEFLFLSCAYNIFAIILVYLFWRYVDSEDTGVIGLKWTRNSFRMLGLGVLGSAFEIGLIIVLSMAAGTLWFHGTGSAAYSAAELQSSLVYGFFAFLLVGFGEEAVFRGYIQKRLMLTLGNRWALLVSSAIFMAAHVLTYGKVLDFIDVGLGGVILGYLYILTDSLYLPAAYHFIYDYLQVNIVRIQDYEHFTGGVLYIFNNSGDVIVSGFNYGNVIEISFISAELIILVLLYVFRSRIKSISGKTMDI